MSPNTLRVHTDYVLVKSVGVRKSCELNHERRELENISLTSSYMPKLRRLEIEGVAICLKVVQPVSQALATFIPSLLSACSEERILLWIPSHVGVPGNEAADELAGRGCDLPNPSSTVLTHSEIHSFQRNKMNLTWRNPPAHQWYAAKSPGLSIQCRSSRAHQTALARLRSGHLRSMTFVQGVKSFFTCPCSLFASPAHLLDCRGISLRQLYEEQDLVCGTITRKGQMDLV
ncbi:uncharacterized protein TNCV_2782191 [Trichonephila clavipes]|nr:uncharacterized protein TNCV_2782191 [Trichonephila clavipes]